MIYTTPNAVNPPLGTVHEPDSMVEITPGEWADVIEKFRVTIVNGWAGYDPTIEATIDAFIEKVRYHAADLKLMPKSDSNAIVQALHPREVCNCLDHWRDAMTGLHAILQERRGLIP
jgi:hypothetical protein